MQEHGKDNQDTTYQDVWLYPSKNLKNKKNLVYVFKEKEGAKLIAEWVRVLVA